MVFVHNLKLLPFYQSDFDNYYYREKLLVLIVRMKRDFVVMDYFPEIFRLKSECRFHNCLHLEEPGCAVKEAVENARLPLSRYESYVALVEGLDEDDTYRTDQYN